MRSRVAVVLLAVYGALVVLVVAWPAPIDHGYQSSITRVLRELHERGLPRWFDYYALEFTANIGMFVPLALLLGLALPARLGWVPFLAGPLFSVAIEVGQALLLPERFGTPRDVLSNSIGAVIGGLLAIAVHAAMARRTSAKQTSR